MAIPSGSGTEVLKNVNGVTANAETTALTVGTNKVVTILNISIFASQAANSTLQIDLSDGSADYTLVYQTMLGTSTYVWNEKLVLRPTHALKISEISNYDMHWWVSYIEQDWT
jgi:hypothetical protein